MRKALRISALLFALSCPTLAGEVHIPPAPQTPPQSAQEPETDGEMHYPLVQLALDLFALI